MRILGVYLENIRSHKKSLVIYPPKGVTVIYGEVGSGKTSLLMGVEFALLGLQAGGFTRGLFDAYKQPQGADLLRVDSSLGRVRLLLMVGNKLVLIERRIVKIGNDYSGTQGLIEEYEVNKETGEVKLIFKRTFMARSEMDDYIMSILGIKEKKTERSRISTPLVFTTALYVPQFNVHEVLSLDIKDRVEIIERSLGLDKYKVFKANSAELLKKINKALEELKKREESRKDVLKERKEEDLVKQREKAKRELDELESQLKLLEEEEHRLKELQKSLQGERYNIDARIKDYEKQISRYEELKARIQRLEEQALTEARRMGSNFTSLNDLLMRLKLEISKLEEERSTLKERISTIDAKLRDVDAKIRALREQLGHLQEEVGRFEGEKDGEAKEINKLEKKRKEVEELVSQGVCPVCRQRITHEHAHKMLAEIDEEIARRRSKLSQIEEELSFLNAEARKLVDAINDLEKDRNKMLRERQELLEKIGDLSTLREKLTLYTRQIEEARSELSAINVDELRRGIEELRASLEEVDKRLHEVETSLGNLYKRVGDLRQRIGGKQQEIKNIDERLAEIDKLKKELEKIQAEIAQLNKVKDHIEVAGTIVSEIESTVLKLLVSEFRRYFYDYLSRLLGDQPLEAVVTDDFGLVRKIRVGSRSFDVASLSGGQNIAISLAYRLALNRVVREYSPSLKRGVLILDEPTAGFSPEVVKRLKQLLRDIGGVEGQAIIVTHDEELIEAGDCKIRLKLDPVEHKSIVEYEECSLSPEYNSLVERILVGARSSQSFK